MQLIKKAADAAFIYKRITIVTYLVNKLSFHTSRKVYLAVVACIHLALLTLHGELRLQNKRFVDFLIG